MFKNWLVLILILVSTPVFAEEKITYEGNKITIVNEGITEAQKEQNKYNYFERLDESKEVAQGEIDRKHELEIEVAKFKNALMLERAGAPQVNVSSFSSSRTLTNNVSNTGTIKKVNNKNV